MKNTFIVITGANSGIGYELANCFIKANQRLLLLSRNIDQINHFISDCVLVKSVDISDRNKLESIFYEANEKFGHVVGLINNAGSLDAAPIHQQKSENWTKMINDNLLSLINMTSLVVPRMISNKQGTIINISSVAGTQTFPNLAVYCAVKHAVHGFSDAIRKELAPDGIRVMTVSPGFTETNLYRHITDEAIKSSIQQWGNALGKILTANEVAEFILQLYNLPLHINVGEAIITPMKQV